MKKLIPAVAYLRKSTAGKNKDGKERQEKSIPQQRAEIEKLAAAAGYRIVRWYIDEGVSGWKRNGKRPEFDRLLREAKERGDFQAVICDDLDRFSRAEVMEVFADLSNLAAASVKTIHCVNQGEYGLGENDIGRIIKMVVDVHGGNDFSRKLSRRVSLSHRNRAKEGKRAGVAPFGFENDGKGGLKHGNRKHLAVVRRIFDLFAVRKQSLNSIAALLNLEGIKAPRGGKWFVASIKELLKRPAYKGEFAYGRRQEGQFFTMATDGEVIQNKEGRQWRYREPVYKKANAYKPVVSAKVWDAAQRRLASFELTGSRRPRNKNPLSGILVCDKCGKPMYGCELKDRGYRVYRCSTPAKSGMGTCEAYEIREDRILPLVLKMLAEEVADIRELLSHPPEELIAPGSRRAGEVEARQKERDDLARLIDKAENNLMAVDDAETAISIGRKIKEHRQQLAQLDSEMPAANEPQYRDDDLKAMSDWWDDFTEKACRLPVDPKRITTDVSFHVDPFSVEDPSGEYYQPDERPSIYVDPRIVNDALQTLGAEVRLRWRTTRVTLPNGKKRTRHEPIGGVFRLGRQAGEIASKKGVLLHKAEVMELYEVGLPISLGILSRVRRVFDGTALQKRRA